MLDGLRRWLATVIAPELVREAETTEDKADTGMPAFAALEESPLGLRGVERARSRELEEIAVKLADMDPLSRDRIIAYARPKLIGRKQILTRHESKMDGWYAQHPNA